MDQTEQFAQQLKQHKEIVLDAVRSLQSALGNSRLYHARHPKALEPLQRFTDRINEIGAQVGPIQLFADFEGITWNGQHILQESEDQKGLGNLLYHEGIAEVVFTPGLTFDESKRLMEVLRTNFTEELEDTLESLLWQAELGHVAFEAVSALAEAEALSALEGGDLEEAMELERALDAFLERGDRFGHPANLKDRLSEEQRNMMPSEDDTPPDEEAEEDDIESIMDEALERTEAGEIDIPKERFLDEYFGPTKEGDKQKLQLMLDQIGAENEAHMLVRVVRLLVMSQLARRDEVPEESQRQLIADSMDALYSGGDVRPVLTILKEGRRIAGTIAPNDRFGRETLKSVFADLLPPYRVAEMLIDLDYTNEEQRVAAGQFMGNMPNDGLLAMLEWSASSEFEELTLFYETLARAAGQRAVQLVATDLDAHNDATLISLIRLIRVSGDQRFGAIRTRLARHRALTVREAALAWYEDAHEIDADDASMLMEAIFDTNASIKQAALGVLEQHRPMVMRHKLEQVLDEERFQKFTTLQKHTICRAYALVAQERALILLERLLMSKLPLFGSDPATEDTIEAAAIGISLITSPKARQVLERESSAWRLGARKQICQRALEGSASA